MNEPLSTSAAAENTESGTKSAILAAAERLFAEHGVQGASMRAITSEAGVNLAAVNYHFGSKEGLVQALLARRLVPLTERRFELLDEAESRAPVEVAEVVRAFVAPALEMVRDEPGGHAFARFILSAFQDPRPEMREMLLAQFEETIQRFSAALERALTQLPREEIFWRFHFMVGVMAHTVGLGFALHRFSGGICDPLDIESVTERMVAFLVGGMETPAMGDGLTNEPNRATSPLFHPASGSGRLCLHRPARASGDGRGAARQLDRRLRRVDSGGRPLTELVV